MGIFSKKSTHPRNIEFGQSHFLKRANELLWESEVIQIHDFFKEGNDPAEVKGGFSAKVKNDEHKMRTGTAYSTFLCLTDWRIFVGWVASGSIASIAYDSAKFEIINDENGLNLRITTRSKEPTTRHDVNTFQVSKDFSELFEQLKLKNKSFTMEYTNIEIVKENWNKGAQHAGHELIAKIAQEQAGTEMADVAVCARCGNETWSPQIYPEGYFDTCRLCLRENLSK